jgi:hypothetical protein
MYHQFQSLLVILVEALTILVVVVMATHQVLDPIVVPVVESAQTVVKVEQVDTVVTEVVAPLTSMAEGVTGTDLTIPMVTTLQE